MDKTKNNLGVFLKGDKLLVSSLDIAEKYQKSHSKIIRDIKKLIETVPEAQANFGLSEYKDRSGKSNVCYEIDRQGFSMLVMGFTGDKAKRFTYQYTQVFEMMLNKLNKMDTLTGLSPQLQLLINLETEQKKLKKEITDTNKRIDNIGDIIKISAVNWREETNSMVLKIANKQGGYCYAGKIRDEIYSTLEDRFGVNLTIRLTNKRNKMKREGSTNTAIIQANKVDIIASDKKLIEGFVGIVKEMCIKNGIDVIN